VIQPTLLHAPGRYIECMKPGSKPSTERMEADGAPTSPEVAEVPEGNAPPGGRGKEAGRILFGLAVLGVGLLGANRGRH
jgi:hypothetical protein